MRLSSTSSSSVLSWLGLAALALVSPSNASAKSSLQEIPSEADAYAQPLALSQDGTTIVGIIARYHGLPTAFRWTKKGTEDLGVLDGNQSTAIAVSKNGNTVIGILSSDAEDSWSTGFVWTKKTGIQTLDTDHHLPNNFTALSDDGKIIVGNSSLGGTRWVNHVPEAITPPSGYSTTANAVSGNGNVVFGAFMDIYGAREVYRWTKEGSLALGRPGNTDNFLITGASRNGGAVFGFYFDEAYHFEGFAWTENLGLIKLPLGPNGLGSYPVAASHNGSCIVGDTTLADGTTTHATLWKKGKFHDLGTLGGQNSRARAVTANGEVIVGEAQEGGASQAYVWTKKTGMVSLAKLLADKGVDLKGFNLWASLYVTKTEDDLVISGVGDQNGILKGWVAHLDLPHANCEQD